MTQSKVPSEAVTAPDARLPRPGSDEPSSGSPLCAPAARGERRLGLALALLAALGVAAWVAPELAIDCPDLNDSAYHTALALRAGEALDRGKPPIDFWHADVGLGFPLFRHYQHLPHLFLVAAAKLCGGWLPTTTLYRIVLGLLLALFPLSVYFSLRRIGLAPLPAACSALVAPLLSTPHLYGLGFESYVWGGSGLYAQLFASVLAPLAVAESYRAASTGRGLWRAALVIAATFVSQLVYGYMVALSSLAFLVPGGDRRRRAVRVAFLLLTAFLAGSYFFVPALRDAEFANHSVWEKQEKWDSLGAAAVLRHLVTGELLDHDRLPVVSVLAAIGLIYALWRGGEKLRLIAGLWIAWTVLYFGRATWGMLVDLLPLARDIPLHRFVGAVHLFAIPLAGCGLALIVRLIGIHRRGLRSYAAGIVLALILAPAVNERAGYLRQSRGWKKEAQAAVSTDTDLRPLLGQLETLNVSRAYVGLKNRPQENLCVGTIPLTAFCLVDGIDTLGFLWIAITYAGDVQVWFNPDDETHCRTFGVRYLVFDESRSPPPFVHPLATCGKYHIYEVAGVSYFDIVEVPFAISCSKRTVYNVGHAWLQSALSGRRVYPALAIAGREPAGLPELTLDFDDPASSFTFAGQSRAPQGRVVRQINRWSCEVDLERPAAVLLRANYHPGLRATVDDVPTEVFPVVPGFAAVQVSPGTHVVHFTYQPATRWPWFLTGALALLLAGPLARWTERQALRVPALPKVPAAARHIVLVLALAILAGHPLLQTKELRGHDAVQYLTQLAEFDHCLRDGQIPPLWAPSLAAGRGEPFFAFYPPLLLVAAQLLHVAGLGLIAAMNLATLALFTAAGVLMYLFARDRWGDGAGLVGATAFLFAPYFLMDLYVRHAFLEVSSFAWMPLAAWGVARGGIVRVAVATALLLLSHPAIAPFFFPGLLIYALACKTPLRTIGGLTLGIGLAAWHVVPAVFESGHLKLGEVIQNSYLHYSNHFAYLDQLAWSPWGFGLSLPGPKDEMSFRVGIPHLAAVILALAVLKGRETRALAACAAVGAFFATTISKPVWDAVPLLHPVQFPTRALAIVAFASAALAGAAFGRRPWITMVVFLAFGLPLVGPQGYREDVDERGFSPARIARLNMQPGTLGIFEPKTAVPRAWSPVRARVVEGDAKIVSARFRTAAAQLEIDATTPARVLVETNHFPGWVATVDGLPATIEPSEGLLSVPIGPGRHSLGLRFEASPLRKWTGIVSLAALAGLAACICWRRQMGSAEKEATLWDAVWNRIASHPWSKAARRPFGS